MSDAKRGDAVVRRLVTFGRILREGGLEVGPGRLQDALNALAAVDLGRRDEVFFALRCTLVSRHDDLEAFEAAFAAFWERAGGEPLPPRPPQLGVSLPTPPEEDPQAVDAHTVDRFSGGSEDDGDGEGDGEDLPAAAVWSAEERLREQDFAAYSRDELLRARSLVERVARAAPLRRSLRLRPAHDGRALDTRRTLQGSMRTEGHPIERAWRSPKLVRRKVVFLVDVSGSMEPYARAMVMFLQAAVQAGRNVEAFAFGTRLTRLTPHLAGRDPDRALERASRAVPDWAGGTRIGENLKAYNDIWTRRGLTRGAAVVIASDGWERGDARLLGQEMARIQRMAHAVVWVNPLAGGEGYRPLVAGMAAALPHVDVFLPGHNLRALETLAEALEALSDPRSRRGAAPRRSRRRDATLARG
jgi:uncharacterized protein with von Willebrand factor type A (vWA) domain